MCALPQFFDFLNDEDKGQYLYVRSTFSSSACKNRRNDSSHTFEQILNTIYKYAIRSDADDWKRCIVCGIFWLDDVQIAVNSKQLCTLLAKCKSSINGSLILLHYVKVENNLDQVKSFMNKIPLLELKPALIELRQWTIRKKSFDNAENREKNMTKHLRNNDGRNQKKEESSVFGINDKTLYCDDKFYNDYLLSDGDIDEVFEEIHQENESYRNPRHPHQYSYQINPEKNTSISRETIGMNNVHIDVNFFQIPQELPDLDQELIDNSDCYFYS